MEPTKTPSLVDRALNNAQIWALQHPDQPLSKMILSIAFIFESLIGPTKFLQPKRRVFGANFCYAGQVVMSEFKTLETALTSPQARKSGLAAVVLDPDRLPNKDVGGRNVFLLSLSDQEAGGTSDHQAFRKCVQDYLINDAATARQRDATAQNLLDKLAADYLSLPHEPGEAFFKDDRRGLKGFLIPYLHYVLFGLDPTDEKSIELLTELHYTRLGTLYYFAGIGKLLQRLNLKGHRALSNLVEQAATIYENSPALAHFQPDRPEYNAMTRYELAKLMVSILSIAALQGPLQVARTAMGSTPLPSYQDKKTPDIDLSRYWDQLDLNDRESVRLYILECIRLNTPVTSSHRVATQPFTTTIAGKEQTFPAGTKVLIPIGLGMIDESFWGSTVYDFNPNREKLCPFHMGFHSVGDRHAGRICPGRDIALDMLVDIIITVGKVRRASRQVASATIIEDNISIEDDIGVTTPRS